MQQDDCSSNPTVSPIASLFARRASGTDDPWITISNLIAELFGAKSHACSVTRLENYLAKRNISDLRYENGTDFDGLIQPLGLTYDDGFRVIINRSLPGTRLRFTLAHELCHTFFYEHVPELKFMPHEIDRSEERLCNFGAAELLMPQSSIIRNAKCKPVGLDSLEELARQFEVSTEAMLVRLRSLRLWNAELSYWRREIDGTFVSEQIAGINKAQWNWRGNELLSTWETGKATMSKTFIEYSDPNGSRRVKPVCYEVQRRGPRMIVLHGTWSMPCRNEIPPLFADTEKALKRSAILN